MGDAYAIAGIATSRWANKLMGFGGACGRIDRADFVNVTRVLHAFMARPAVFRGLGISARPSAV